MGATYRAAETFHARALARPTTVTDLRPNSFAKTPGVGRSTRTLTVSLGSTFDENVIPPLATPPPFFEAYDVARDLAVPVSPGSACAAASAEASAVDWAARCALYQEPTSTTSAAMPSITVRNTSIRTVDCPCSFLVFIRLAPWSCS